MQISLKGMGKLNKREGGKAEEGTQGLTLVNCSAAEVDEAGEL